MIQLYGSDNLRNLGAGIPSCSSEGDMICTISLNPALNRTLWVEKIQPDDSNQIEREERYASGKGIDVSRVLFNLGVNNTALGFVGGLVGEEL